jgi:hypothetical protein
MRQGLCSLFLFIFFSAALSGQSGKKRGFTPQLHTAPENLPDSLLHPDSSQINTNRITAFRLTGKFGERYMAPVDTMRLNFSNSVLMEGRGAAVAYLANIGSPAQSRIFSERGEEDDFIFARPYQYYITTSENALFYDARDPYTRITYTRGGGQQSREEMFTGVLTSNFGKKINIGTDFDYTYARGQYTSNSNKLLSYRLFGNYLSDRYEMHAYLRNYNCVNTENGGITNDSIITHTYKYEEKTPVNRQTISTRYTNTWNRVKGMQLFLTHRYNLGFYRGMTAKEKEEAEKKREIRKQMEEQKLKEEALEEPVTGHPAAATPVPDIFAGTTGPQQQEDDGEDEINAVFVPISSIIHTLEFERNSRRFISEMVGIDTCYENVYGPRDSLLNDYTQSWYLNNTIALSLREGFQDWVKSGLTAYVHFEKRRFTLPSAEDSLRGKTTYDEFSTYLGAELSKQQGRLFTYKARGEFCPVGSDMGEFRAEGEIKSQFRLSGKNASVKAHGYIKNLTPAFYTRHHHSRYFTWDSGLKNTQRIFVGGEVDIEQTRTGFSAGVETIRNYIYFGKEGVPEQHGSLQVITARIKQDFRYKAFGWENEVTCQLSSEKSILPLPQIAAYTNIYLDFTLVKVLHLQIGADAHYHTAYYAPYYEPATQQFQLLPDEKRVKIGNYPIINAYANFQLKQARFFISGYNMSSLFIRPTEYFSLPHYPLNPMLIKLGISVFFNN